MTDIPEIRRIPQRQFDIEELAHELEDEVPFLAPDELVCLASSIIDELYAYQHNWNVRCALAYGLQLNVVLSA